MTIKFPWSNAGLVIDAHVAVRLHLATHRVAGSNVARIIVIEWIDPLSIRRSDHAVKKYDDGRCEHVSPIRERAGPLADDEFIGSSKLLVFTGGGCLHGMTDYYDSNYKKR